GAFSTCGVTQNNVAYCWGSNRNGQLGDGTQTDSPTPVAVAGGHRFRQVRVGVVHTCGITPLDVAFCWGENSAGELGDGTTTQRLRPVRVLGGLHWHQLSANGGAGHTCGVTTADRGYCWGLNGNGELGDGTTTDRPQ